MILTRVFFQIHYPRRLLITYWLNDFLSGNLVSFCIVSSAFKLLLHPDLVSSFVWSRYGGFFCNWTLSSRLLEKREDYQPRFHELYRGSLGVLLLKTFGKLDSQKRHILHSLDWTQLIHTCILLSFSQSIVIHDSWAEVQRFMIPKFLKQRFKILTWFVSMIHDWWFRFHPGKLIETDVEFIMNLIHPVQGFVSWKFRRMSLALGLNFNILFAIYESYSTAM